MIPFSWTAQKIPTNLWQALVNGASFPPRSLIVRCQTVVEKCCCKGRDRLLGQPGLSEFRVSRESLQLTFPRTVFTERESRLGVVGVSREYSGSLRQTKIIQNLSLELREVRRKQVLRQSDLEEPGCGIEEDAATRPVVRGRIM